VRALGLPCPERFKYVWVNEQGERTRHLHKHIIADLPFIEQKDLSRWAVEAGLGARVWVEECTDAKGGALYAVKALASYMSKGGSERYGRYARTWQSSTGLGRPKAAGDFLVEVIQAPERTRTYDPEKTFRADLNARKLASNLAEREVWAPELTTEAAGVLLVGFSEAERQAFDWSYKRAPLSNPRGGGAPDAGMPELSLASVPDGCEGALGGRARRHLSESHLQSSWRAWRADSERPWGMLVAAPPLLSLLDLEKKCAATLDVEQEMAA
jgi:hypothetical protein